MLGDENVEMGGPRVGECIVVPYINHVNLHIDWACDFLSSSKLCPRRLSLLPRQQMTQTWRFCENIEVDAEFRTPF